MQIKRADALVDAIMEMNTMELTYTINRHATYIDDKCFGIQENTIRPDWPTPENVNEANTYINETDAYKQEAEKLESLFLNAEFFEKLGMPISVGGATSGEPVAAEGSAAVEPEKVVEERKSWDIELTAYPSTKKIAVIKDIKAMLGLGLKESKEMVESAPVVIKKGVPLEEVGAIKEKLETIGCTITLK
jgi:large subunit ribosomal protein L7/L12